MKSKGKHTPTHTLSHLQLIQTLLTPETVVTLTGLSTGDVTGPQSRSQQVQTTNGPGPDRQLTADHLTLVRFWPQEAAERHWSLIHTSPDVFFFSLIRVTYLTNVNKHLFVAVSDDRSGSRLKVLLLHQSQFNPVQRSDYYFHARRQEAFVLH